MQRVFRVDRSVAAMDQFNKPLPLVVLLTLDGRKIKSTTRNQDGTIDALLDQGRGRKGLLVRFADGEQFEKCRRPVQVQGAEENEETEKSSA